jgi:hypothetical protein
MKSILTFLMFGALLSAGPIGVTLINAGNPVLNDGIKGDVSPYTLSAMGMNYPALCVDDKHWSTLNTPWSANLTTVASSDLSKTYHSGEGVEYEEDAYLYTLITQASGTNRINLQHAAWDIINHSITSSTSLTGLTLFSGDTTLINDATQHYSTSGLNFANFDIVSSVDSGNREQEFIIGANCDAPEPTSFGLLSAGLFMAGASRAWRHRKQVVPLEAA